MNKNLQLAVKGAATIALLWLSLRHLDMAQIRQQLANGSLSLLALAVVMMAATLWLIAVRWQIVLNAMGSQLGVARLTGHNFVGFFFSQAVPSAVGEGIRVWLIYRDGATPVQAISSVIIERLAALCVFVLFASIGLPTILRAMGMPELIWPVELAIYGGVIIGVCAIRIISKNAWLRTFKLGRRLVQLAVDAWNLVSRPQALVGFLLCTLCVQFLSCMAVWVVSKAIGFKISVGAILTVMPSVFVLLGLPISIAGWGLREGAMGLGLGLLGVATSDAIATSIIFGLVNLIVGLIGGGVWLLRKEALPQETLTPSEGMGLLSEQSASTPRSR